MHALHLHGYVPLETWYAPPHPHQPSNLPNNHSENPTHPSSHTTNPSPLPHRPKTLQRGRSLALRKPTKHDSPPPTITNAAAAAGSQHAQTEWDEICASVTSPTGWGTVTTITAEGALRSPSPRSPLSPARLGELGGRVKALLGVGR
ncbi:hypothetical protein Tdes44962_MAKER00596 [Teratosphaeria destructans]|uniref:Uncharacterized protein n=1 Tax=Teratosphaeria destructans TaxID=418781 RepID=A0A9W7W0J1_9PEZI|nr:hypothetical protein Tdes44962_MAKER00596 [Teratosphaeria destructans]